MGGPFGYSCMGNWWKSRTHTWSFWNIQQTWLFALISPQDESSRLLKYIWSMILVWRYHQSIVRLWLELVRLDKAMFRILDDSWPWPLLWLSLPGRGQVILVKETSIRIKKKTNNESHGGPTSPSHQQKSKNLYFLKYCWWKKSCTRW